jgi:hypothetical protein
MMSSTAGVERYCSLTLSVRQDDMNEDEMQRAVDFFEKIRSLGLSEHISSCAERGDQENRLHLQTMMSGEWCPRKCNTLAMKTIIAKQKIFTRGFNCCVNIQKTDENRSMESLCGCGVMTDHRHVLDFVSISQVYPWWQSAAALQRCRSRVTCSYTLKNKELGQEGWGVMYVCGGCAEDDFIENAFLAHRLACKKQIYVGKIAMNPTNTARNIVQFRAKQMRSLKMHPAQYARLMSNSGHYVLGPEMVASGTATCDLICLQVLILVSIIMH